MKPENITSLTDLFSRMLELVKNYERNVKIEEAKALVDVPYSVEEIIEIYPMLSDALIRKAIKEDGLPCIRKGTVRYLYLKDIDDYLKSKKVIEPMSDQKRSWRKYEEAR